MFKQIDNFNIDINALINILEHNTLTAKETKHIIDEYQNHSETKTNISNFVPSKHFEKEPHDLSFEDEVLIYITEYQKINSTNLEQLPTILPNKDDYHYNEILLRLCAESLKEIKYCEELKIEESLQEDPELDSIIETEKQKITRIKKLLEPTNELTSNEPIQNKLILMPNLNDSSILKDIEKVPLEYYAEVSVLLESIINNTFKKSRKLYSIIETNGFYEVKGTKIRIVYKRLNNNTYAIITIFMKKTTTDNGYRDFIRGKMSTFSTLYSYIKDNLDNPEFLALNETYLQELYQKLGMNSKGQVILK